MDIEERIHRLDTSLFRSIHSQTSEDDRRSLLLLQAAARSRGRYAYLEIGSHLGGTIQPYYVDPLCTLIYSIDKRPMVAADERGSSFVYTDNSTTRMLDTLAKSFPEVDQTIRAFDCDASQVDVRQILPRPVVCFIDGEHTNRAVRSDFAFCQRVCDPDGVIAFHDAYIVAKGIKSILRDLGEQQVRFRAMMLGGNVFAILLNRAVERYAALLQPLEQDSRAYFRLGVRKLWKRRIANTASVLDDLLRRWRQTRRLRGERS